MANTVIQIKRSNASAAPTNGSLAAAEPAYSFNSDKLFLGNTAGTGVVEVGGKFYVDMTQLSYAQANAAYAQANASANSATVIAAFSQANTARDQANTSFLQANTARDQANTAFLGANAALIQANTARDQGNTAFLGANAALIQANTARTQGNTAFTQANSAYAQANAAYLTANSKLSLTGGTITGNLSVTGSISVAGNTYIISAEELKVSDPLIYLAGNNYVSDIVDIGFIGNYVNATGSNVHTGLYREHEDKMYYLFNGYDVEPANNHIGAFSNNMVLAVLNADLRTSNLVLGNVDAISWISAAYVQANTARNQGNTAFLGANAALIQANTARDQANTARDQGNTAFTQANSAYTQANASFLKANSAAYLAFGTVSAGGTSLVADSNNDTLSITSGNGIVLIADSAADSFNIALSPTGVTGATYGGAATVGVFTVDAWGRITSASNSAIAISASAVTSGTLPVGRGGTGQTTFTTNGVLYGQGASALAVTAAGTEGQVLQASATGVPNFGMLDGGTF